MYKQPSEMTQYSPRLCLGDNYYLQVVYTLKNPILPILVASYVLPIPVAMVVGECLIVEAGELVEGDGLIISIHMCIYYIRICILNKFMSVQVIT